MKPLPSEYLQYILHNTNNYKPLIQNTSQEILAKFTEVIIEYMLFISEKINIKNRQHYIYIFKRGIETITHIFTIIFYYTKNLDLTFYHTQKAYYFYIEFIEQISDDNITFLQLSSRDALLFVYKKTIFDLNNEYKKTIKPLTNEELTVISYTDTIIDIYKKIFIFVIQCYEFKYENKIEHIKLCCDKIQKCSSILNKHKFNPLIVECIYSFINLLTTQSITINLFFNTLEKFIKRLHTQKKILDGKKIINKIYTCEIHLLSDINELSNNLDGIIEYI